MDSMEIDTVDQSNGTELPRLVLRPVMPLESGEGLPYAPENWPNPGDIWRWKVGPRITVKGTFTDRYIYPPKHLPCLKSTSFRSKTSLQRYITMTFPDADVEKFFASFSWTIPSSEGQVRSSVGTGQKLVPVYSLDEEEEMPVYSSDEEEDPVYSSDEEEEMFEIGPDTVVCKAGNDKCGSLMEVNGTEALPVMPCDICCSEGNFCSDCSCVLCCKPVSVEHGGYSFIKCEAVVSEGYICGHVTHVNCALRAYMAGTIGGSIGLDAEYYCRRCDAKKDLVPHVSRFLEICQAVEYQGDVEKILNLGVCILRGTKRENAKELLNCIESTIVKLKCGTSLENIWTDDTPTIWSDFSDIVEANDNDTLQTLQDVTPIWPMPFNYEADMHKFEEDISEALKALRKAQESEYHIAEEKLNAQKECLDDLYRQLEKEKSELSRRVSGTDADNLRTNVLKTLEQIKREIAKLKEMEEVAKGFGSTPRGVLEEYFHLRIED